MNQRALSTVLLRILGILLTYLAISQLSQGYLLAQGFAMMENDSERGAAFVQIISASHVAQVSMGVLLCLMAGKISSLLFKENSVIIAAGNIDGRALLPVGIGLIGLYILANNFPGFLESGFHWFKTRASTTTHDDQLSSYGPMALHSTGKVVIGLVLSAKRFSIARLMSSPERKEPPSGSQADR